MSLTSIACCPHRMPCVIGRSKRAQLRCRSRHWLGTFWAHSVSMEVNSGESQSMSFRSSAPVRLRDQDRETVSIPGSSTRRAAASAAPLLWPYALRQHPSTVTAGWLSAPACSAHENANAVAACRAATRTLVGEKTAPFNSGRDRSDFESFEPRRPDRAVHRVVGGRGTILLEALCMGAPTNPTGDTSESCQPPNPN